MKNKRTKVLANMQLDILLYLIENNLLHEFMEEVMNSNWWETTPEAWLPNLSFDSYFDWAMTEKGTQYWYEKYTDYLTKSINESENLLLYKV